MTQSASGRVRGSWESISASAAISVKNPKDKRLVFIGFCLLVCLGPFGLGARLAQVGVGGNKKKRKVCASGERSVSL